MDDDGSSEQLLLNSDKRKMGSLTSKELKSSRNDTPHLPVDSRSRKSPPSRAANALFFGVVLGFIFSFLFAYSGVLNESDNVNFSIYEYVSK